MKKLNHFIDSNDLKEPKVGEASIIFSSSGKISMKFYYEDIDNKKRKEKLKNNLKKF